MNLLAQHNPELIKQGDVSQCRSARKVLMTLYPAIREQSRALLLHMKEARELRKANRLLAKANKVAPPPDAGVRPNV